MASLTWLLKPVVHIPVSYLLLAFVVYDYWHAYGDVFAVGVALANNWLFLALLWTAVFCSIELVWATCVRVFFGALSFAERELMLGTLRTHGLPLVAFAFLLHSVTLSPLLVCLLLTLVVYQLHKLAEERALSLGTPDTALTRAWQLWQLTVFTQLAALVDYAALTYLWQRRPQRAHGTAMYTASDTPDAWTRNIATLLFIECFYSMCITQIRLAAYLMRASDSPDDSSVTFYVESLTHIAEHATVMAFIAYIFASHRTSNELLLNFVLAAQSLGKHVVQLHHYRRLMRKVDAFDVATPESLARESRCVICYEDMTDASSCKQLPCRHCYHVTCLQKWFRSNYTCPYCRADLLRYTTTTMSSSSGDGGSSGDTTAPAQQPGEAAAAATTPAAADTTPTAATAAAAAAAPPTRVPLSALTIHEEEIRAAYLRRRQRAAEVLAAAQSHDTDNNDDDAGKRTHNNNNNDGDRDAVAPRRGDDDATATTMTTAEPTAAMTQRGRAGVAERRTAAYERYRRKIQDAERALQAELRHIDTHGDTFVPHYEPAAPH